MCGSVGRHWFELFPSRYTFSGPKWAYAHMCRHNRDNSRPFSYSGHHRSRLRWEVDNSNLVQGSIDSPVVDLHKFREEHFSDVPAVQRAHCSVAGPFHFVVWARIREWPVSACLLPKELKHLKSDKPARLLPVACAFICDNATSCRSLIVSEIVFLKSFKVCDHLLLKRISSHQVQIGGNR